MSLLSRPAVARLVARGMQLLTARANKPPVEHFPELPRRTREIAVPTRLGPARAVLYLPEGAAAPPVHVNFHGGGFVLAMTELDDPLCRFLAAEAGVAVLNVDYAVAPQHPFPAPVHQAFEIVRWAAEHGGEHGWDGTRLTVGGQSAGASLAAAAARQAFERGEPRIALQVLHYPPLDLVTPGAEKHSPLARPALRPWMSKVFDHCYVPRGQARDHPLLSPAAPADTADLTGIAPALVITAEYDTLRAEGERYARRLEALGALAEHVLVPAADHGYDVRDSRLARETYSTIAGHLAAAARA